MDANTKQTHKHKANTQTPRHTNTQSHRHTDTHTNNNTRKHTKTDTQAHNKQQDKTQPGATSCNCQKKQWGTFVLTTEFIYEDRATTTSELSETMLQNIATEI